MLAEEAVEYFRQKDLSYDVNEGLSHVLETQPENPREALATFLSRPRKSLMTCHIYAASVSANSVCCVAAATAMDIPYELKTVDMMKGEHKSAEFLAINCLGQVPALHIPELNIRMGESCSILRTLANCFHVAPHWYPINQTIRAEVDRWLDWRQTAFYPPASAWLYHCVGFANFPNALEKRAQAVDVMNTFLDKVVKDAFAAGSQVSIADISIVSLFHFVPADPTFTMPESWALYWNRVKDACGRKGYDAAYTILDGFVSHARERNASQANFLEPPAAAAAAPAPAAADAPAKE